MMSENLEPGADIVVDSVMPNCGGRVLHVLNRHYSAKMGLI